MPLPPTAHCWYLTGPTASGKTEVGLRLAERLGAEIVSLDSMAVFRGLDIGTAKPGRHERLLVPHHLVDLVDPWDDFSLARYVEIATAAVRDIESRGRTALFVGGTPLYLKSLLRGIFEGPEADWTFRRRWMDQARQHENGWLHEQLRQVDPDAAARLHANDTRRLIRALEVQAITGQPISRLQQQFELTRPAEECRVVVLDWPRPILNERIDRRVEAMFAAGLVDEVRGLLELPQPLSRTARQALGYREVLEHLQGARSLAETISLVQQRTRQFAKRQLTWLRSLSECRWLAMHEELSADEVAEQAIELVG